MIHRQSFVADCHNRYIKYKCCFKYTFYTIFPILIIALIVMFYIAMGLKDLHRERNLTQYYMQICEHKNKNTVDCEKIYSPDLTKLDQQIELNGNIVLILGILVIICSLIVSFIDRMSFL